MKHAGITDSSLKAEFKPLDVKQVLSYAVVSVLQLLAIYYLVVQPQTDPSEFMSSLTLP